MLPERKSCLEIGSFEGRSMVWTVENMLKTSGNITCVDTWKGGEEHASEDMETAEWRFDRNCKLAMERHPDVAVYKYKGLSTRALSHFSFDEKNFDFIYIDGSHTAPDVLTDACMAWPLLKPKGIMVFDDYMWGEPRDILHRPKPAIDAFCNIFAEQAEIVHVGYQLVVRKKGE
jgi:predicted O-methyltransferase YrrM